MILYDWMFFTGRPFNDGKPLDGFSACQVNGWAFYAKAFDQNRQWTGTRHWNQISTAESSEWSKSLGPTIPRIVNIEQIWDPRERPIKLDIRLYGGREVESDIMTLGRVLEAVRAHGPTGFYGFLPAGFDVFNRVLLRDEAALSRWRLANDYIATRGMLLERLDMLCPSLYTNSPNVEHWVAFATRVVEESRRLTNKPCIPFIKPTYHPSTSGGLGNQLLPVEFWRQQITTLRRLGCEGVILWQGNDSPVTFEQGAEHVAAARSLLTTPTQQVMPRSGGTPAGRTRRA